MANPSYTNGPNLTPHLNNMDEGVEHQRVLDMASKKMVPEPKEGLNPAERALYSAAKAHLMNEERTPTDTPIIGSMPVAQAVQFIQSSMGTNLSPAEVIMKFGQMPETPEIAEEEILSITSLLDTVAKTPTIPLAIVGDAGTGKTSIIRQWAIDHGYELNLFLANTASEDDVAGAISPDHTKKLAVTYPLEKLHRSVTDKTVLFLDELNTARREVQDPLLTLIQDRCLPNGEPLHSETIIVTAINPSATYNNHELSPQLRNRFMWYYHKPSEYDWGQWLQTTSAGQTMAGKQIVQMILAGTIKFDKDEAFTDERNEFTTPRSLFNLLTVSAGSIERLKLLAETLVSAPIAEAIRLHGYADKNTRGNTFFNERAKVERDSFGIDVDMANSQAKGQSYQSVVMDEIGAFKGDPVDIANVANAIAEAGTLNPNNGLDAAVLADMAQANTSPASIDPLTGSATSSADEDELTKQINARLAGE